MRPSNVDSSSSKLASDVKKLLSVVGRALGVFVGKLVLERLADATVLDLGWVLLFCCLGLGWGESAKSGMTKDFPPIVIVTGSGW